MPPISLCCRALGSEGVREGVKEGVREGMRERGREGRGEEKEYM